MPQQKRKRKNSNRSDEGSRKAKKQRIEKDAEKNLKSLRFCRASRVPSKLYENKAHDITKTESEHLQRLLTFLRERNVVAYAKLSHLFNTKEKCKIKHAPTPIPHTAPKNKKNKNNKNEEEPNLLSVGFIISYKNNQHEIYVQKKMYFSGKFYSALWNKDKGAYQETIKAKDYTTILQGADERKELIRESLTKLGVEKINPSNHFHSEVFAYADVKHIKANIEGVIPESKKENNGGVIPKDKQENIEKTISDDVKAELEKTISKAQRNQKGKIDKIFLCFDSYPNAMCDNSCREAIHKIVTIATDVANQVKRQSPDKYNKIYGIVNSYRYFCDPHIESKQGRRHEKVHMIELPPAYLVENKKPENNQSEPKYSYDLFDETIKKKEAEHKKPIPTTFKSESLEHYIDILVQGKRMLNENEFIAFNEEDLVLQIKYDKKNKNKLRFAKQTESRGWKHISDLAKKYAQDDVLYANYMYNNRTTYPTIKIIST